MFDGFVEKNKIYVTNTRYIVHIICIVYITYLNMYTVV